MSTLLLVRHGQARFGTQDYDRLSERGEAQAACLADHWLARGQRLDALISGGQQRQRKTLEIVARSYARRGRALPAPAVWDAFNEYDADGLFLHVLPELQRRDAGLRGLVERLNSADGDPREKPRMFQQVFEVVMNRWIAGDVGDPPVESWKDFKGRVVQGIERVREAHPKGETVAVFTSGGPIAVSMQHVLRAPDTVALGLNWVVKNASITEFRYAGDAITLTGFNLLPHIQDDALITHR